MDPSITRVWHVVKQERYQVPDVHAGKEVEDSADDNSHDDDDVGVRVVVVEPVCVGMKDGYLLPSR